MSPITLKEQMNLKKTDKIGTASSRDKIIFSPILFLTPSFAHAPLVEWQRGQLLGRGAFGSVFLGLNTKTGVLMAVKQITLNSSVLKKSGKRALRKGRELERARFGGPLVFGLFVCLVQTILAHPVTRSWL